MSAAVETIARQSGMGAAEIAAWIENIDDVARTSGTRLSTSWRAIPHVTQHGSVDVTDLEAQRRRYLEAEGDPPATASSTAPTRRASSNASPRSSRHPAG